MELLEYINSNDWDTNLYRHIKWDWDDCWIQCDKGKHSQNKNLTTEDLELAIKLRGKEWKEVAIYLDRASTRYQKSVSWIELCRALLWWVKMQVKVFFVHENSTEIHNSNNIIQNYIPLYKGLPHLVKISTF